MATLPVLFAYPQPPDVFISDFTIQIYDSLLGILFWGAHAFHLMIWDWCSGELVVDYPAPAGIHFDDFSFLSGSSFLIPSSSVGGAALRVYSFAHLLPSSSSQPTHPLGRAPHHLEFDNAGRRVAPSCWTPPRPDGTVRSFHIGNYVFCVSNLEEASTMPPGAAGLSGLSRRPELRSLLRFPKPKKEWNVGIMTCRVDPLPRAGVVRPQSKEGDEEGEEETRFAPARAFHADPDRAIIALSSGLVPVRGGIFAGVVYLDEGSIAWEEGEEEVEVVDVSDLSSSSEPPPPTPPSPPPPPQPPQTTDPPPLTTLVPWIDLHMPPSSLPTPAEPPLMSVFDHSSASSGHAPIQIQIHDALLGEDQVHAHGQAVQVAPVPAGYAHVHHGHPVPVPAPAPPAPAPEGQPPQPPGLPAPFVGALPFIQGPEDDIQLDDSERLYFNLFVHCRALRRFAEKEDENGPTPLPEPVARPATSYTAATSISFSTAGPTAYATTTPTQFPSTAPTSTFTSSMPRIRSHRPRVYDWDDWAPPITRLLTRMPMPAWACISHGQRFATLGSSNVGGVGLVGGFNGDGEDEEDEEDGDEPNGVIGVDEDGLNGTNAAGPVNPDELQPAPPPPPPPPIDPNFLVDGGPGGINLKRPVRVLDFNPFSVRRNKDVQGKNRANVVDYPTLLPAGRYWEKDVKSALPYREVITRGELLLSGVMIDGERVLGMRSDERGNVSSMHVMQV